jgi:response regulator RpfG family c-di-GMP phosphodiesterase
MSTHENEMFDEILFAAEASQAPAPASADKWKLLVADDDQEVHSLTRLVLSGFTFEGRGIEFMSAYSGVETVELIRHNPDTALILLDVVMEQDDAGLQAVRRIRDEVGNHFVRIILRTGQPGQAPEQDVVSSYDINDYKAKTELTAQKLYTTVTAALRAYRDIRTIERHRLGLELINNKTGNLFDLRDSNDCRVQMLECMADILAGSHIAEIEEVSGIATLRRDGADYVISGVGEWFGAVGVDVAAVLDERHLGNVRSCLTGSLEHYGDDWYANRFETVSGELGIIYLHCSAGIDKLHRDLLGSFGTNARMALDNIVLNQEIFETQREVIFTLGDVVETRSQETANHVDRVSYNAYVMAQLVGMDDEEAERLRMAAPLHDVGKIGIPDSILNKPGRYEPEERAIMQKHAEIGHQILGKSKRDVLKMASMVAHQHHECWDGSGYPQGLVGEAIDISARIVALVDVFDALSHARIYKPAYPLEKCLSIITELRGKQFDPTLVDIFVANLDQFHLNGQATDAPGVESPAVTEPEAVEV